MKAKAPDWEKVLELLQVDRMHPGEGRPEKRIQLGKPLQPRGELRGLLPETPTTPLGLIPKAPWEHLPEEYWPRRDAQSALEFAWGDYRRRLRRPGDVANDLRELADILDRAPTKAHELVKTGLIGIQHTVHLALLRHRICQLAKDQRQPGSHHVKIPGQPPPKEVLLARLWRIFDRFHSVPTIGNTSPDASLTPFEEFIEEFRTAIDPENATPPKDRLPALKQLRENTLGRVHLQCLGERKEWLCEAILAMSKEELEAQKTPATLEVRALKKAMVRVGKTVKGR